VDDDRPEVMPQNGPRRVVAEALPGARTRRPPEAVALELRDRFRVRLPGIVDLNAIVLGRIDHAHVPEGVLGGPGALLLGDLPDPSF
jgi:hypothetical protein